MTKVQLPNSTGLGQYRELIEDYLADFVYDFDQASYPIGLAKHGYSDYLKDVVLYYFDFTGISLASRNTMLPNAFKVLPILKKAEGITWEELAPYLDSNPNHTV